MLQVNCLINFFISNQVGIFLFVGPFALFYLVSLFWTDYYLIPTCYLCWYLWDIPSSTNGGRSGPWVNWVRSAIFHFLVEQMYLFVFHIYFAYFCTFGFEVMASLEIECCILPCDAGEDCRPGPQEKPPYQLPSSWHTLLWSCGM